MPGDKVEPELIVESGSGRKMRQIGANGLSEGAKQGLAAKSRDADVGRSEPSEG